jgi:hypothetical protein
MLYIDLSIIQFKDVYVLFMFPIPFMQNGYLAEAYLKRRTMMQNANGMSNQVFSLV